MTAIDTDTAAITDTAVAVTDPRDPRLLDAANYAALQVSAPELRAILMVAKAVNASDFDDDVPAADLSLEVVQGVVSDMLATGSGERFPLPGGQEIVVLRFIVNGRALSVVFMEDYEPSSPALVDGHVVDWETALGEWMGDTLQSEHPELFGTGPQQAVQEQIDTILRIQRERVEQRLG